MTQPLSPEPNNPDPMKGPDTQSPQGSDKKEQEIMSGTNADLRENLTGEGKPEVQIAKYINEDDLKGLREQLNKPPEFLALSEINAAIAEAKRNKDAEKMESLLPQRVECFARLSQVFLRDAEAECAMPDMDLVKTRVLIHLAYNNAKLLSAGNDNNPVALNALKEWQAKLVETHPEAAKKLAETYVRSVEAGTAAEKPDCGWIKQWIDLCNGFAPERTPELMEKYHAAAERRCEFLIAKIVDELAKEKPDISMVTTTIGYPPNYYVHLKQGSTVPVRVEALKSEVDALKRAVAGN